MELLDKLLVTGVKEQQSKYGGIFYYVYFKDYNTGNSYKTCLTPNCRNYKNWTNLINNYKDKVVEVENVRANGKLIDADSLPKIIISEKGENNEKI